MGFYDLSFLQREALSIHQRCRAVLDFLTVHGSGEINVLTTVHRVTTACKQAWPKEAADRGHRVLN
jgi:hypothetical protein